MAWAALLLLRSPLSVVKFIIILLDALTANSVHLLDCGWPADEVRQWAPQSLKNDWNSVNVNWGPPSWAKFFWWPIALERWLTFWD